MLVVLLLDFVTGLQTPLRHANHEAATSIVSKSLTGNSY